MAAPTLKANPKPSTKTIVLGLSPRAAVIVLDAVTLALATLANTETESQIEVLEAVAKEINEQMKGAKSVQVVQ